MESLQAPTAVFPVAFAAPAVAAEASQQGDFAPDVVGVHAQLLRFARSQVRNSTLAEDAVSESVLVALASPQRFASRSQATAWMFGVLRHKLIDQLRQQQRESPSGDLIADFDSTPGAAAGAWSDGGAAMNNPEVACRQQEFLSVLDNCCRRLAPSQAQAFMMRDVWGLEASAISERLEVTENHFWVLLHRARHRLRTMLPQAWPMQAD
jgi:RNA polymerase sigma-70 factor (TIGR02943 family)